MPRLHIHQIGLYDNYSGLNRASLSVIANFAVNGKAAGSELADDFRETGNYVWALNLSPPIASLAAGKLSVRVKDLAGNTSVIERTSSVSSSLPHVRYIFAVGNVGYVEVNGQAAADAVRFVRAP